MEEVSEEAMKPRMIPIPYQPTAAQIEEHEMTGHVQYRSWCRHCVAARGVGQQHKKVEHTESEEPEIACDYAYMRSDTEKTDISNNLPMLVIKDSKTKMYGATFVSEKGVDPYAVKYFASFIQGLGYKKIISKSDGEHSIVALKEKAAKEAGVESISKEAPRGDHQANGLIESAVREIKAQVRVIKSTLEEKLQTKLEDKHPLLAWLPRHAADLISRYKIGQDGRTAEQRRTGRAWNRPLMQFGEKVMFKLAESIEERRRRGSLEPVMREGWYIGHHARSGALLLITPNGVIRGSGVRRLPEDQRWDKEGVTKLSGLPWEVKARASTEKAIISEPSLQLTGQPASLIPPTQRRRYVTRADVEKFGPTDSCPGCTCVMVGGSAQVAHNERCRNRIAELLAETEEGKRRLEEDRRRRRESKKEAKEENAPESKSESPHLAGSANEAKKKRKAESQLEPVHEEIRGQMVSESTSNKRPAEEAVEQIDPRTQADVVDVEDLVSVPIISTPVVQTEKSEQDTDQTMCSLEPVFESVSSAKNEMKDLVHDFVRNCFAAREVDVSNDELRQITSLCLEMAAVDVAEIYSPPRFTALAANFGLRPGFAVDLATGWDLSQKEHVEELERLVEEQDPYLLTGSPPCDAFSILLNISKHKRPPEVVKAQKERGRYHLQNACQFYQRQIDRGRFFLHEAPKSATSWQEECVQNILRQEGIYHVVGPMCRWEMVATDNREVPPRTGYVLKETGWMTNSPELAETLSGVCTNKTGTAPWHRHVQLIGGNAAGAAVYPPKLVEAVLRGLRRQMETSGDLSELQAVSSGPIAEVQDMPEGEWSHFWDHVNGGYLNTEMVRKARSEELEWVRKAELYEVVPRQQCLQETGKPPVTLRWVDTNKGDDQKPNYRSRLVMRDIKAKKSESERLEAKDLFACMPPLEAFRGLCSLFMSLNTNDKSAGLTPGTGKMQMRFFDISRAHFYGKMDRQLYVELPEEEKARFPGQEVCGLLKKSWYGVQDASRIWQGDYTQLLTEAGFKVGVSNAAVFYSQELNIRVIVHGDDFMALSTKDGLDKLEALLRSRYELKVTGELCLDKGGSVTFLNRLVKVNVQEKTLSIEPDARHAQLLIKELGLEKANGVETPAEKKSVEQQLRDAETKPLNDVMKKQYRSCVMRAAYLAQDDPGINEATKNLARRMNCPLEAHWTALKRLARYLLKYPMTANVMKQQKMPNVVRVYVDTDHAGCAVTRRSTTGMVLMLGMHTVKTACNLQSTIALSSGESEWYGLVKGSAVGLGFQSLMSDWNISLSLEVLSDSSAARGFSSRKGLGKMRHIQTRYLWVQERVHEGHLKVVAIKGTKNPADVLTKPVSGQLRKKHLERLGFVYVSVSGEHKQVIGS